jgi:integrase/recombinase XerD
MLRLALEGRVTVHRPQRPFPFQTDAPGFLEYLRTERGLRESTVSHYLHYLTCFSKYLTHVGLTSLRELSPALLASFVIDTAPTLLRTSRRDLIGCLRIHLRFCYRERITSKDLSGAVEMPQSFRLADVPRSITWDEVRRLRETVDRRTVCGRRDYAILLLLVTYGLRGHEVAKLTLDDIDWDCERLRIPERKAGHSTAYPLAGVVAESTDRLSEAWATRNGGPPLLFPHARPPGTDYQWRHIFTGRGLPPESRHQSTSAGSTHLAVDLCSAAD